MRGTSILVGSAVNQSFHWSATLPNSVEHTPGWAWSRLIKAKNVRTYVPMSRRLQYIVPIMLLEQVDLPELINYAVS